MTAAARSRLGDLPDALDRAIAGTDLGLDRRPLWWRVVGGVQWLVTLAAVVGLGWLVLGYALRALGLPALDNPMVGQVPLPTVLLLGGLLAGLLVAALTRPVVRWAARRARTPRRPAADGAGRPGGRRVRADTGTGRARLVRAGTRGAAGRRPPLTLRTARYRSAYASGGVGSEHGHASDPLRRGAARRTRRDQAGVRPRRRDARQRPAGQCLRDRGDRPRRRRTGVRRPASSPPPPAAGSRRRPPSGRSSPRSSRRRGRRAGAPGQPGARLDGPARPGAPHRHLGVRRRVRRPDLLPRHLRLRRRSPAARSTRWWPWWTTTSGSPRTSSSAGRPNGSWTRSGRCAPTTS